MRVAVVGPGISDRWDEAQLTARRVAGALAHHGRVTILVPGTAPRMWSEGLFDIHQHASVPGNPHRAFMLEHALHGGTGGRRAEFVPPTRRRLEEELFLARGEYAPGMVEELTREAFDVVVFAGVTGHTAFCSRSLPERSAAFLAAVPQDRRPLHLGLVTDACARADAILVTTEVERELLCSALPSMASRVRPIGFIVRTNELAAQARPNAFPDRAPVVVVADWDDVSDRDEWVRWATMIENDLDGAVQLRALGPGANRVAPPLAGESGPSRIDLWRWTSHALAAVDPLGYANISVPSLEALCYGTPLIAPASGGAARHHAEVGNCGLWYRSYDEFRGCVELLLGDDDLRSSLARNGRHYVDSSFGDTDLFVKGVLEATQLPAA